MKCIIIEDQPPAQRILQKYIADTPNLDCESTFTEAVMAIDYLHNHKIDLMFLDIHLPKISGTDFLKSLSNPPYTILTTAYSEYALEGFDLNVIDYLLKPFSFQRFLQAIAKVPKDEKNTEIDIDKYQSSQSSDHLYIKSGHEHIKVSIQDIYSISSDSDYTELILNKRKILSSNSLRQWLDILPGSNFCQVHKSHIINKDKIDRLAAYRIVLSNGSKIPLGRAYKEAFMKSIIG